MKHAMVVKPSGKGWCSVPDRKTELRLDRKARCLRAIALSTCMGNFDIERQIAAGDDYISYLGRLEHEQAPLWWRLRHWIARLLGLCRCGKSAEGPCALREEVL